MRSLVRLVAALGLAAAAFAQTPAPTQTPARPFDFKMTTLSNGMRVITLEDFSCPTVAVQVWYHVGSKDESPERQGFAHMFEHMMFRGTDRLGPKDHFELIRRVGGDCNAFTIFDNTTYVNELPANQLPLMLWLESERMAALKIDEGGFQTERKVVEEERRLGLNRPYGTVLEKVLAGIFTQHPYRWSTIGQIPHLRAATAQELQDFWDKYYVPSNATLVIVGAVKNADAQKLAEQYFGWIPRCPDPPRITGLEPEQKAPKDLAIQEDKGPVPVAGFVFRTVKSGDPDEVPLQILFSVLGGGESSRLYKDLVRDKKVAVVALAGQFGLEQDGLGGMGGALMPFGDTQKVLDAMQEHIDRVRKDGITDAELAKAKNQMLRGVVTTALTVASKANLLGQAATIDGDPETANRQIADIRKVTLDDVKRVANEYLVPERRTTITVKPSLVGMVKGLFSGKGAKEDEGAPEPEAAAGERAKPHSPKATAKRPSSLPEKPPLAPVVKSLPELKTVDETLPNGLRVVVLENHEVPFVTATLGILAGAFTEDPAKPGVAEMACSMITKGTTKHDAVALAEELERNAISIGAGADLDAASVYASAVTDQFATMMPLMAEVVREPTFPASEFETLRNQSLTGMLIASKQAEYQAEREMRKRLFGSHPYARTASGEVEDVKRLKAEDLAPWWKKFVRPDMSVLYIAGDVDPKAAIALSKSVFGDWKVEGPTPETTTPPVPDPQATHIYLVDRPGSVQSQIRAGHVSATRTHPRYFPTIVLSQVFGGSFGSRLNDSIRVKKGLTYGAGGGFSAGRFAGTFRASTFTKTPTTGATVKAVIEEIQRIIAEPPKGDELEIARSYLAGSFVGDRETPQAQISDLWTIERYGLSKDYFAKYLAAVSSMSTDDLAAAAKALVHPDQLTIVVVGEADRIKDDLAAIAPVTIINEKGEESAYTPKLKQ
ncbi:MAG: insulinase family protein [Planctomycetes bacterium]|nr:insulinase family protein [Planctomycetota bacterium]